MVLYGVQLTDFRSYNIAKELGREEDITLNNNKYKAYFYKTFAYILVGLTPYIIPEEDLKD